jgi:hypothetical protein
MSNELTSMRTECNYYLGWLHGSYIKQRIEAAHGVSEFGRLERGEGFTITRVTLYGYRASRNYTSGAGFEVLEHRVHYYQNNKRIPLHVILYERLAVFKCDSEEHRVTCAPSQIDWANIVYRDRWISERTPRGFKKGIARAVRVVI